MNLYCSLLASTLVLAQPAIGPALRIAPPSIPQRVATADLIVTGTVVGFEEKTVEAARFPGDTQKTAYMVAQVKVGDVLLGGKGIKEVRVGFVPPPPPPAPGQPQVIIRRQPQVNLLKDQDYCLMLTKHPGGFYYVPSYYQAIQKTNNGNFDRETAEVRRCAGLLTDAKAGLESKAAEDRLLTACMLVARYRTARAFNNPNVPGQEEAVDAAESKAILKVLAAADWTGVNQPGFRMTPQSTFSSLGLTDKDGWTPPKDFKEFPEEAKKWLEANAETYRIKRVVVSEAK